MIDIQKPKSSRQQEKLSPLLAFEQLSEYFGISMTKGPADRIVAAYKAKAKAAASEGNHVLEVRCYAAAMFVAVSSERIQWSSVLELRTLFARAGDQYVAEAVRRDRKPKTRKQLREL